MSVKSSQRNHLKISRKIFSWSKSKRLKEKTKKTELDTFSNDASESQHPAQSVFVLQHLTPQSRRLSFDPMLIEYSAVAKKAQKKRS